MDKDNNSNKSADKKSSASGNSTPGQADSNPLLDAAFAYWGQNPAASAAAQNQALFGNFGASGMLPTSNSGNSSTDRYSMAHQQQQQQHHNTMVAAASQAQALTSTLAAGLHPNWWSMAVAAQDYFSRLQASQLGYSHHDLAAAAAFPSSLAMSGVNTQTTTTSTGGSSRTSGNNGGDNKLGNSVNKNRKEKNKGASSRNESSYKPQLPSSPSSSSSSAYKSSLYNPANLHKELLAMQMAAAAAQSNTQSSSSSKKSNSFNSGRNEGIKAQSHSVNAASNPNSSHHTNSKDDRRSTPTTSSSTSSPYSTASSFNALNSLSQLGNVNLTSQQSVTAAMNALAASSSKVKDYMESGILNAALEASDSSSILGVRLPPDTEIIKYTSSIVGPKIPGTTNRGRKKTISLDPNPFLYAMSGSSSKRARLENEFAAQHSDRVEVIKLPATITSNGIYNLSKSGSSTKDTSNVDSNEWSNVNPANKSNVDSDVETPLNLCMKAELKEDNDSAMLSGSNSLQSLSSITAALGTGAGGDRISRRKSTNKPRRLDQELTSYQSSSTPPTSNSYYASIASPTQTSANANLLSLSLLYNKLSDPTFPSTSNNDLDNDYQSSNSSIHYKEGRPRNLGRGVSKPKKNTVASLLAQSRAVGIKPMLSTQQLLSQGGDLDKIRQAITEANASMDLSTDSESLAAESGLSESEEEQFSMPDLKKPIDKGWKRETVIQGLTKNGQIRGDVYYNSPGSQTKLKNLSQIQTVLDQQQSNLTQENFSFSARAIVGIFLQPAPPPYANDGEYIRMTDVEVSKRLEELKMFTRHATLGVEQRIEIARQQQALRDAKKVAKDDTSKSKDKVKQYKEIEKYDRIEQQRREREIKNQQALEARRKRQEQIEKLKLEENQKKQQIYLQDLNKQKELLYTVELERERRRQHMILIRQLDNRKKYEDREKKKHQIVLDKLISREKKLTLRKRDMDILMELRKPQEDSELNDQKEFPELERIPGQTLTGQALADLFMVFEFLHNFGETLGFDMESLPSMQSLHRSLTSDNTESEDELLSIMTHLLVCTIEDPGIPNPLRHTTLLGQSLRQADITNANISEILRIYLYAVATGEVRQQSGINFERDRDRKVADHHQSDADMILSSTTGRNSSYYEHLYETARWKLSECLREKPFVALNATIKAKILAQLCNDLLLNKAVVKQIDGSLESQSQLKKDRYLLENKIRKYKSWHMRKLRMESYEKSQSLAMEKATLIKSDMDNLKSGEMCFQMNTESSNSLTKNHSNLTNASSVDNLTDMVLDQKDDYLNSTDATLSEEKDESSPSKIDLDSSSITNGKTTPDINSLLTKNIINKNISRELDISIDAGLDEEISDLESEGTQAEDAEDLQISSEEVQKKLEKLLKTSYQTKNLLAQCSKQLRATCYGQDRYWRRYWHLPNAGGIFVESLESAQPDIFDYHRLLEEQNIEDMEILERRKIRKTEHEKTEQDLRNIKSELNLSDHTQIIKYEADSEMEKMEEKCVQQSKVQDDSLMDIEDSIPTAILVQKLNRSIVSEVEVEKNDNLEKEETAYNKKCNGTDDIDKLDEEKENQLEPEMDFDDEKSSVKNIIQEEDSKNNHPLTEKWFSIVNREMSLNSTELNASMPSQINFSNTSCDALNPNQGNRWDIGNNIHNFNVPYEEFSPIQFKNNISQLSLSGLDENLVDAVTKIGFVKRSDSYISLNNEDEDFIETKPIVKLEDQTTFSLPSTINLSLHNLSSYIQCDTFNPLQMTSEEQKLLETVKSNGLPKKIDKNFVVKNLRHGWWKINNYDELNNIIESLHLRGVREKELRVNLLSAFNDNVDLSSSCDIANSKRNLPPNGYAELEHYTEWNNKIAHKVEMLLLEQVEAMEDKVAGASMQIKGWLLPQKDEIDNNVEEYDSLITTIRDRILGLEGAIERRYLKPPLGTNTAESQIAAITQNQESQKDISQSNVSLDDPDSPINPDELIPKGLVTWREAVSRSNTSAQLAMTLHVLESCVAWDKSIMKANCQFCHSGECEDKLLLCDGCDKGYHTYCFKPKMEKIPEGDWYCFECVNKATTDRKCIVCGGHRQAPVGKMILCELCPRAYHQDCYIPPLLKIPRGKWYCHDCVSKAPPPKKRPRKLKEGKELKSHNSSQSLNLSHDEMPLSPTPSTSHEDNQNLPSQTNTETVKVPQNNPEIIPDETPPTIHIPVCETPSTDEINTSVANTSIINESKEKLKLEKKEKHSAKKLMKELIICKIILEEMELHEDSWPFLLPVNTKQFPTYKKIIKQPMDLSTVKKRVIETQYKSRDDFIIDVRQIFDNCEVFNEDDSPVGKAGHGMRKFFEIRWGELTDSKQS